LISITLGLLTVIGGYLSFASLEGAAGQCLECRLNVAFAHVGMARAGPYYRAGGGSGLPDSAATEPPGGCGGRFRIYRPSSVRRFWPRTL